MALKKAEDSDLNIILIEPNSVDFTGFLNDLLNEKGLIVVNKSDLGIDKIDQKIKKYNPIYLSIKEEKNLDAVSYTHLTLPTICSV